MNVAVLSAGTWGISLAALLHGQGHAVRVWEFAQAVVDELVRTRRHPKLAEFEVPAALPISTDLRATLTEPEPAEVVVCAVPAAHVRATCKRVLAEGYAGQPFVILSVMSGTISQPSSCGVAVTCFVKFLSTK